MKPTLFPRQGWPINRPEQWKRAGKGTRMAHVIKSFIKKLDAESVRVVAPVATRKRSGVS